MKTLERFYSFSYQHSKFIDRLYLRFAKKVFHYYYNNTSYKINPHLMDLHGATSFILHPSKTPPTQSHTEPRQARNFVSNNNFLMTKLTNKKCK